MPLALSATGPKTSMRDRVAGQGEHADAAHRHAVGDEERRACRVVAEHREEDGHGDDHHRGNGRLVADGEALDDVGGVAGLAGLGHALDRLILGVRVVARHLVQRDRQDDADQAGPGRAAYRARRCRSWPRRASRVGIAVREAGGRLRVLRRGRPASKLQVGEAQDDEAARREIEPSRSRSRGARS